MDPFEKKPSPEEYEEAYTVEYFAIEKIMSNHFPSATTETVGDMVHFFIAAKRAALMEVWNYKQEIASLGSLRLQLQKIAVTLLEMNPLIFDELKVNFTLPIEVLEGKIPWRTAPEELYDTAPTQVDTSAMADALSNIAKYANHIDQAIKYTQTDLPEGIPRGKRAIPAWRVVEAAAELTRAFPGTFDVPSSMNGSGPMRRFLVDLFVYYAVNSNIDSAFNGWREHIDSNRENLNLWPID